MPLMLLESKIKIELRLDYQVKLLLSVLDGTWDFVMKLIFPTREDLTLSGAFIMEMKSILLIPEDQLVLSKHLIYIF